jgi:hypothetical protein
MKLFSLSIYATLYIKNIVPIHLIKKYSGSEGKNPLILNLVLDGGEWLTSRSGSFTSGKNPVTTGASVGPRAGLDGFGEEKIACYCRNSNPGSSSPWLVLVPTALLWHIVMLTSNFKTVSKDYDSRILLTFCLTLSIEIYWI